MASRIEWPARNSHEVGKRSSEICIRSPGITGSTSVLRPDRHIPRYPWGYVEAVARLGLGERDRALDLLEAAEQERDSRLIFLGQSMLFDELRGEERFEQLVARIGIPNARSAKANEAPRP